MNTSEGPHPIIEEMRRELQQRDLTFLLQVRARPDRHSYQVGILGGLLIVAIGQLVLGLPPQSALYDVISYATLIALNSAFIAGSILTLSGAALSREHHFLLSVRLGIFGHLSTCVASMFYSATVILATDSPGSRPYWLAVTSVGLSGGLIYASIVRFFQMCSLLRQYQKRQREPAAGDDSGDSDGNS